MADKTLAKDFRVFGLGFICAKERGKLLKLLLERNKLFPYKA